MIWGSKTEAVSRVARVTISELKPLETDDLEHVNRTPKIIGNDSRFLFKI